MSDDIQSQRKAALINRDEAKRRLHWHLTRAAAAVASDLELGGAIDREMAAAEEARAEWLEAIDRYWRLYREPTESSRASHYS